MSKHHQHHITVSEDYIMRYKSLFGFVAVAFTALVFANIWLNIFVKECKWNDWGLQSCLGVGWPVTPSDVRGVDVTARDGGGNTLLHLVVRRWGRTPETVEALLRAGADVNAVNKHGSTPLHESMDETAEHLAIAKKLIEWGANAGARDDDGDTPLHLAAWSENAPSELADILFQSGADVNAVNGRGNTPLHFAAERENMQIAVALIDAGADVNARGDESDQTPLHLAMENFRDKNKQIQVVKALLDAGADASARDANYNTALHLAMKKLHDIGLPLTNLDISRELLPEQARVAVLAKIASDAKTDDERNEAVKNYVKATNDAYARIKQAQGHVDNSDPLSVAMDVFNIEVINALIQAGADVNARDWIGATPLHRIASSLAEDEKFFDNLFTKKITEVMAALLRAGADINARDNDGATPLHYSLRPGIIEKTRDSTTIFLIRHGADVNVRDDDGNSPLSDAERYSRTKALVELRKAGAQ